MRIGCGIGKAALVASLERKEMTTRRSDAEFRKSERLAVSLKTLADQLDTTRTSVRRWLSEAGVQPVALGRGANGAIRYRWSDVKAWLDSLESVS